MTLECNKLLRRLALEGVETEQTSSLYTLAIYDAGFFATPLALEDIADAHEHMEASAGDLRKVAQVARSKACGLVQFDSDGLVVAGLMVYEWEY